VRRGDHGSGKPGQKAPAAARGRQHRGDGDLHHPRDRRTGPYQGLPVSSRGNHDRGERHGCHQRHYQGPLSPGRQNVFHNAVARGARDPARDRGGVGPRRSRDAAALFRLYREQHQRKTDQFRVYRADRGQASASAEGRGGGGLKKTFPRPWTREWQTLGAPSAKGTARPVFILRFPAAPCRRTHFPFRQRRPAVPRRSP